jgi:hypothetical protein
MQDTDYEEEFMALGAIPYPPELIEKYCDALGYDDKDRQFMRRAFQRHALGKATRPERVLLFVLNAMVAPVPAELVISAEADTEFEIKIRKRVCTPKDVVHERDESDNKLDKSDCSTDIRSDEKPWGLGYLLFKKPGSEIDQQLLERAKSLVLAMRGRVGVDKCEALIVGVRAIYADLPQTWAAWNDRSGFLARKDPDEQRTFHPDELDQVGAWLGEGIDRKRTVMFLVPLVGFCRPPLIHYRVPDLPRPGDSMMSSEELLKIFDVSGQLGVQEPPRG